MHATETCKSKDRQITEVYTSFDRQLAEGPNSPPRQLRERERERERVAATTGKNASVPVALTSAPPNASEAPSTSRWGASSFSGGAPAETGTVCSVISLDSFRLREARVLQKESASLRTRAALLSVSVEDLLRLLAVVQAQVHACRKAVVREARATGHSDREIAAMLRLHVSDFASRFPV